jgi:hypothetical protein
MSVVKRAKSSASATTTDMYPSFNIGVLPWEIILAFVNANDRNPTRLWLVCRSWRRDVRLASTSVEINGYFSILGTYNLNVLGSKNKHAPISLCDFLYKRVHLLFDSTAFSRLYEVTLHGITFGTRRGVPSELAKRWRARLNTEHVFSRLPTTIRKLSIIQCSATDYGVQMIPEEIRNKISVLTIGTCSQIREPALVQLQWPSLVELRLPGKCYLTKAALASLPASVRVVVVPVYDTRIAPLVRSDITVIKHCEQGGLQHCDFCHGCSCRGCR